MKTEWSTVGGKVTVEVVTEETSELLSGLNVRAGGDHVTTGKRFIEGWVISPVQFVHDDFPDGMRSGRAVLSVTMALVGHAEVQSVRPDGDTAQWGSDGSIVDKELVSHHFELLVSTNTKEWSPDTDNATVGDVCESIFKRKPQLIKNSSLSQFDVLNGLLWLPLNNQTIAGHFSKPVIIGSFGPVNWAVLVGNGKASNFMSLTMQFLHG